ncbi:MAG TPA: glutathione S-transferase family protein [Burkholderiaceae bacterium]|nr:glutathione S-transferase family protein [Burkholderiaceae bacterium]
MKLIIGNKNYSSWSMRPWILLRHAGIAFEEMRLSFNSPTFKQDALRYSPVGKVPILVDGAITVWDTLAIAEYVAEKFRDKQLWPADLALRAHARAICAEMHSGFANLRSRMSMNVTARLPGLGWDIAVQREIDRIASMWLELRQRHGARGPFLFGSFSVADAYYAPVVMRFQTYAPALPAALNEYRETMLALPAVQAWCAGAERENEFVVEDEPYRLPPA